MTTDLAPELDPIYQAACVLGMKGFQLIRVKRHSKVPFDERWPEVATNDVVKIDEWFLDGGFNVGLACGLQPNGMFIVAIDIDPKNGGLETWQSLTAEYGRVGGVQHTTPHGGYHLPLIFPPDFRNTRNRLGPGIDTRGAGGQIVLPPSTLLDHTTGEILSYGCRPGRGLFDMDPIEAPSWIVELLSTPAEVIEQSKTRHPSAAPGRSPNGESPLDYIRRTVTGHEVMQRYNWVEHSVHGDDTWYTRPGKSAREGSSAVVHADGAIVVFTTTDVEHLVQRPTRDGTGLKMSVSEFIAAHETGGDLGELSRRVRQVMPSDDVPRGAPATIIDVDEPDEEYHSWSTPVNLAEVLAGTREVPKPTILVRTDGKALFYPGKINGIHGDSGLGKGWVVLAAAAELLQAGNTVMYIDLEDTVESIVARLTVLGISPEAIQERFIYLHPSDETSRAETDRLVCLVEMHHPALVILDSLGEAFGLDSVNEDKDNEVGPWLRALPRRLAEAGPCVVTVDHATKAGDNPLHPSGSKRKRAAIGGASYLVEAIKPLVQGRGGVIRLTTAKDRNGQYARNEVAAEILFTARGADMRATVRAPGVELPPSEQEVHDGKILDAMSRIMKVTRRRRGQFGRDDILNETAGGRRTIMIAAWNRLIEHGEIVLVGPAGRGAQYSVGGSL